MSRKNRSSSWPVFDSLSAGAWVILGLAVASSVGVIVRGSPESSGRTMWMFAPPHKRMYDPIVADWNTSSSTPYHLTMLSQPALERRMLSAFLSRTPCADLLEVERKMAGRAFAGPVDAIGFLELTDLMRRDGLLEDLVPASMSPWSSRGRVFGLPHDVHPVMLGYRADIIEAAGIDLSLVETWHELIRALRPLMADHNADGQPDRFVLNFTETHNDHIELLLLQAGGGFFDESGRPILNCDANVRTLATLISWCVGPDRIGADAPDFSASGNQLKIEGYVLCGFMPDWMCNIWRHEMPQLAGKVKLMPLPAWERGGRRTSVWGGTMLGIAKTSAASAEATEELWSFAKNLYFSSELSRALYRDNDIITPVKKHWSDPIFDQPDPYFCGQRKGRMYIELASGVPGRAGSPYNTAANLRILDAATQLADLARARRVYSDEELAPLAREVLDRAQDAVASEMSRNLFLDTEPVHSHPSAGGGSP